jgi:hypothetical protein
MMIEGLLELVAAAVLKHRNGMRRKKSPTWLLKMDPVERYPPEKTSRLPADADDAAYPTSFVVGVVAVVFGGADTADVVVGRMKSVHYGCYCLFDSNS